MLRTSTFELPVWNNLHPQVSLMPSELYRQQAESLLCERICGKSAFERGFAYTVEVWAPLDSLECGSYPETLC